MNDDKKEEKVAETIEVPEAQKNEDSALKAEEEVKKAVNEGMEVDGSEKEEDNKLEEVVDKSDSAKDDDHKSLEFEDE